MDGWKIIFKELNARLNANIEKTKARTKDVEEASVALVKEKYDKNARIEELEAKLYAEEKKVDLVP